MTKHLLFLIILSFNQNIAGQETSENSIDVWVQAVFSGRIVRSKVKPFFDYLSGATQKNYHVNSSSDVDKLLKRCKTGNPALFIGSIPVGDKLRRYCQYKFIAVAFQNPTLFVKKNSTIKSSEEITRLGLVRNIDITDIAIKELSEINHTYEKVMYSTFFELMKNYRNDNVDAVVLTTTALKVVSSFAEQWQPIHKFKQKGRAVVMISPTMDKTLEKKITNILLSNEGITAEVFQNSNGLSPFYSASAIDLTRN